MRRKLEKNFKKANQVEFKSTKIIHDANLGKQEKREEKNIF